MINYFKNRKKALLIFAVLFSIILTSAGLNLYNNKVKENKKLAKQKTDMIALLQKTSDSLETKIAANSVIKKELFVKQQRIVNLMAEIKSAKFDLTELSAYKQETLKLRKQIAVLEFEKTELTIKYDKLKSTQDSTLVVLQSSAKTNLKLKNDNNDLNTAVKTSNRMLFASLTVETGKKLQSGIVKITNKQNAINNVKLNFVAVGNKTVKPVTKEYFVQIIDPDFNVIGNKYSIKFGPKVLDYSYSASFTFIDKTIAVSSSIDVLTRKKGEYLVNVFDQENLVLKSSFYVE